MNIIVTGLAGSLRSASFNRALLQAAGELMPPASELRLETIRDIPIYDGDLEEAHGVPAGVAALKDRIASTDALLLASPEYNNSLPGPLKNAIDWLSRPSADIPRVFGGRPVGLIGATPGPGGTRLAQTAWLPVFRTLGMLPFFGKALYVSGAATLFDDARRLVDADLRQRLAAYLAAFVDFVRRNPTRPAPR